MPKNTTGGYLRRSGFISRSNMRHSIKQSACVSYTLTGSDVKQTCLFQLKNNGTKSYTILHSFKSK